MLKDKIKNHWPILILALAISFLVVRPTLFAIYQSGWKNFNGVYPIFNDDESHYLAMTKEVADGHSELGSVFYKEHKSEPPIQPSLTPWLFAKTAKTFHLSIPQLFAINDFLLPLLGMVVLYYLFLKVSKSKLLASLFAVLYYLFFLFSFGRPINPQFSFILLFVGIILIWDISRQESGVKKLWRVIALGTVTGILVYIYPYCWTAVACLWGVNLIFSAIKEKKIYPAARNFAIFFFGFILAALPYLINLFRATRSPYYRETIARYGLLNSHYPAAFTNIAIILIAAAIIFFARKVIKDKKELFFSYALLLSAVILNWQNVITGKYLQFSSHYYQVTILFSLLALIIVLKPLAREVKERGAVATIKQSFLLFIILILFFTGLIYKQAGEIKNGLKLIIQPPEIGEAQQMKGLFDWLNKNTAPDSVIYSLASDNLTQYLPIYTHNNLYSYGYAGYYLMSDSEIEDRWARQNIFNDRLDAEYILANHRSIWLNKFIDPYQNKLVRNKIKALVGIKSTEPTLVPPEYIGRVLDKYNQIKKEDPRVALKKYEINYILLDSTDPEYGRLKEEFKKFDFIEEVKKIDGIIVYRVI